MPKIIMYYLTTMLLALNALTTFAEIHRADWDTDDDGLIEINDFEDLNAIRFFLDGSGLHGETRLCFSANEVDRSCNGFELTTDIDFDTNGDGMFSALDSSWNAGKGWVPIGEKGNLNAPKGQFNAIFNGNGFAIKNLQVREIYWGAGLFAILDHAEVHHLSLTGHLSYIESAFHSGALAAEITNSLITGIYSDINFSAFLVAGGITALASHSQFEAIANHGHISSLAAAGLIAQLKGGDITIKNSLSSGRITEFTLANNTGEITVSQYPAIVGGGEFESLAVEHSFWLTEFTGYPTYSDEFGVGVSAAHLQCEMSDGQCGNPWYLSWKNSHSPQGTQYWHFTNTHPLPVLNNQVWEHNVDSDNDRVLNAIDAFPFNVAVAIDHDLDGLADKFNANCDIQCQSDSGITLDAFLFDTDNDGIDNSTDTDDNGDGLQDVDADSNGYLDIHQLADLHAMRYDLTGSGMAQSIFAPINSSGCPISVATGFPEQKCRGHELKTHLDFDTNSNGQLDTGDDYWNQGTGWQPVGAQVMYVTGFLAMAQGYRTGPMAYTGLFKGNGFQIKNLYINRPDEMNVGLFGVMMNNQNFTVESLLLTGSLAQVTGRNQVGAFAGQGGAVFESVSTVNVSGEDDVGGITGSNGACFASFSTGDVNGTSNVGGVIGKLYDQNITACLSTGTISAQNNAEGGLVGDIATNRKGKIFASYSIGPARELAAMVDSYAVTPKLPASTVDVSIEDLQCPTFPGDANCDLPDHPTLFQSWYDYVSPNGEAYWDFGSRDELPGLMINGVVYRDADGDGELEAPANLEN